MLGSTFVLPQAGGDITCNLVNQDAYSSEYRFKNSTVLYRVFVRHTFPAAKADGQTYERHNVEVTKTTFANGAVLEFYEKFYFVWEVLSSHTSVALADAVADKIIVSSNALLTGLLNNES